MVKSLCAVLKFRFGIRFGAGGKKKQGFEKHRAVAQHALDDDDLKSNIQVLCIRATSGCGGQKKARFLFASRAVYDVLKSSM
jgi:hypothetical protein